MQILDKLTILSLLSPALAASSCHLLSTLPDPLKSLDGTCITTDDCTGYASPGFCQGASNIQCCTDTFAGDNGASTGELSDFGLSLIQAFEGFVNTFYCDGAPSSTRGHRHCLAGEGKLTIGWGHLCNPESSCDWILDSDLPISRAFGDELMRNDVQRFVDAVNSKITVSITQNQFDALVSFIYNCGPAWLQSVAPKVNAGDFAGATARMKECNTAGGVPNSNLRMRRGIETNVFDSPSRDVMMLEL